MMATVDVYGARREINLMLLPEEASIGDFVLVHAGFAIQKVSEKAAEDSLNLIREMIEAMDDHGDEI
jgi:hydrogenase expression/formation protein HypC